MTILVYSKDAGGAEIISSWIREKKIQNFECILEGPAKLIFKKKFKSIRNGNLKNKVKYEKFYFSTSFPPNNELKILRYFKKNNLETFCFLDHWVNYKERLTKNKILYLPDKFLTFDQVAYKIAKKTFKKTKIIKEKNFYIKNILLKINKYKKEKKYILIISSPRYNSLKNYSLKKSNQKNKNNLMLMINKIISLKKNLNKKIILIRPHPSEKKIDFSWLPKKFKNFKIMISNKTLLEDLSKSEVVVGSNSMAFIFANLMKKRIYNFLFNKKNTSPIKNICNFNLTK